MVELHTTTRRHHNKRPTIGVIPGWQVHGGVLDSFLPEVFRGIQAAVAELDCNLMLAYGIGAPRGITLGRPAWPLPSPDADFVPVGPWNTDGLIVIPPLTIETGRTYFRSLIKNGFPVVFAGDNEPGPSAIVDNEGGIQQAFDHLIGHGHRRIAYIAGWADRSHGDSYARLESYINCVKKNGLELNPVLIAYGYHSVIGGRQAINEIYNRKERFSAVITSNDEAAVGAMQGLRDLGLLVPQDVAVIGFDDRLEAKAQVPILTTVVFPMYEMGYRSVEILLEFIQKGVVEPKEVRIPVRLVIRESCGCLPGVTYETVDDPASSHAQPGHVQPALLNPIPGEIGRSRLDLHSISKKMTEGVYAGTHILGQEEIEYLCDRVIEAFKSSLAQKRPETFRFTIQQIIERISSMGEDLYSWQAAISFIRDHLSDLDYSLNYPINRQLAEDLLHEARIAISEVARGQATRELINRSNLSAWIGQLTTYLFSAHDEAEVYSHFSDYLPYFSIRRASVALYQAERDDPYAWSHLCFPALEDLSQALFATRSFPPRGLFPEDEPFHLAILPLLSEQGAFGYVAFDTDHFDRCAEIARQLAAALKVLMMHQEAIESRKLAEERRHEAEEANRLKSRFLSMVSHELRTPLHLISGLSDILLHENERPGHRDVRVERKDLERIFVSSQHLDGLIRDVLDLARSDIGQLKLMREPLVLKEVLETVSIIGEQLAHDKNLEWMSDIPDNLPKVWGDRTRLRQVALNLVANAVKFTTLGQVLLKATEENGEVTVSVSDTGLGIPLEEQVVIFDEFRQSDRTTARGYGGLGLGLAICKRLVEMHGGTIGVYSSGEEGSGSRFYFTLPAIIVRQEDIPSRDTSLAQAQQVALLASVPAGGNQLVDLLTRHGINVETIEVGDDDESWIIRLLNANPDVAVLDQGLTSRRGWEMLKVLNGNPILQGIPVLFYRMPADNGQGSLLEISYLTKPVGKIELAETLISKGFIAVESSDSKGGKILIVDDEPAIVELHTRIIKSQIPNSIILKAYNGREALEKIHQEQPNLVLLDLMMPEINGFQVLSTMRGEESSRNIPVIVLTSQSLTQDDMDQLNAGVVSVLNKGMFNVEEIVLRLKDTIARKHKPGSDSQRNVLKAMAFIHANYAEAITRNDVAKFVGLSERHLTRCFRQETGITPITYLNRFRVKQAKVLLDSGEKSISRVALDVGFSTGAYFARVFQDEVGKSPRDYLRSPNGGN